MKHSLLVLLALAAGAAQAQQFDMRKPASEPCATALADGIKRANINDAVLITYTVAGKKCHVLVDKSEAKPGTPDRIELGRLKTIAGHSGKPAK